MGVKRGGGETMKIISLRQPWAHLVVTGAKDIENRSWATAYRGPVLIHASLKVDKDECANQGLDPADLETGAVIGIVELIDCIRRHTSRWFFGPFGLVLRNARQIKPIPWKGALGLRDAPKTLLRRIDKSVLHLDGSEVTQLLTKNS